MRRISIALALAGAVAFALTIATDHFDNNRQSWNASEVILTPSNITTSQFGKIGTLPVDGAVYASQLLLDGVTISGVSHSIVIVGTNNCTVYAFDQLTMAQLWTNHLCSPRTSYPDDGFFYHQPIGCLSTPVADSSFVYAVCVNSTPTVTLYKIALATGSVSTSTAISGTYGGLAFSPSQELQRMGLTLANGNVYVGFSGYDDASPWNGWVFAYATSNLSQVALYAVTPTGSGGGIWQAGGGFAVDGSGNLYVATGNGTYDGTTNFANSILKLSPSLTLLDWFTPANYATLSSQDLDMASGRVMLLPGTTNIALGEKDFQVYVVDSTCMGHLQGGGSSCTAPVIFPTNPGGVTSSHSGIYGGMFMNNVGYWPNASGGEIYAFSFSGGAFNQTPIATSVITSQGPGAQMMGSSNGASNGIVWAVTFASSPFSSPQAGTLHALNASTLAEIWNSGSSIGNMTKFSSPVVGNGQVFVSSYDNNVAVFGLVSNASMSGQTSLSGQASLQ